MRRLATVLTLVAALAFSLSAFAAAPGFMPVQGFLTDADGQPVDGDVSLTFTLWDNISGGTQLFTETQQVLVEQGFFTLFVGGGGGPAMDLALFRDNGSVFLGIAVNGEAEMQPRLPLGTVPYAGFAQYAGDALTLGGHAVEEFRLGADQVSWDDLGGVPDTLLDGDADTLASLTCATGQVTKWNGVGWECADDVDTDTTLTEAEVDAMVDNNGYALAADLSVVAFSGDWNDLVNVPAALLDGDADTLAGIACGSGQVIKFIGGVWACADDVDTDTTLTEAEVDAMVDNNGYALAADLAPVALSGDWNDLVNVPVDQDTLAGLSCADGQLPAWDDTNAVWECVDDLDTDTLMTLACADGQLAKWDAVAGAWACADDIDTVNTGDITGVLTPAGSGLAGGGTSGDLSLSVSGVTSGMIQDGTIINTDIAPDTILASNIAAGAVGTSEIADNSVGGVDITDGTIALADISTASLDSRYALTTHNHDAQYVNLGEANSITSAMIVDGTITSVDIAPDTITAADIAASAVGTSEIADGTILGADINTGTTITAANFLYATAQTRYLMIAGGQCQLKNIAPTNQYTFFCQLGSAHSGYWAADLPNGATVLGMQTYFWSSGGTINCRLRYGISIDGTAIATNTTTLNGGWHWSAEAAANHTVNTAAYAYGVECTSDAASNDQPVGVIRIRYTVPQPY